MSLYPTDQEALTAAREAIDLNISASVLLKVLLYHCSMYVDALHFSVIELLLDEGADRNSSIFWYYQCI